VCSSDLFTRDAFYKHGEDKMSDVLQMIAEIYSGDSPELCEIVIDATQIIPASPISIPVHYSIKYSDREGISWEIKKNNKPWEADASSDELFGTVEYLMNENEKFTIEFGEIDPTPQCLYDHSGGEMQVSAGEIYAQAVQQKREARA
ncbi:MAG: hypothetical protein ACO3LE_11530, partial [Bdellovibrionota bacterium]